MSLITQAVIAAGGKGTRLRPTTDTIPKVMIPILGIPLLEHHVQHYKKHGVTEFFFTLQYLPEVITSYFGDGSKWGVKIHYFIEQEPLGSGGGVKQFESQLGDVFYFNWGDTFSLVNYSKTAEIFSEKPKDAIGMQRVGLVGYRSDVDLAELDQDMRIVKIHVKPHSQEFENPYSLRGSLILRKRILSYIPENSFYEIGKQLLPTVIEKGEKFYGYECDDYSKGIDTIEKWKEVEEYLKKKGPVVVQQDLGEKNTPG